MELRAQAQSSTPTWGSALLAPMRFPLPAEDLILVHVEQGQGLWRLRLDYHPLPDLPNLLVRASTASTGARSTMPPVRASVCSHDFSYVAFVARASAALSASSPSASPR